MKGTFLAMIKFIDIKKFVVFLIIFFSTYCLIVFNSSIFDTLAMAGYINDRRGSYTYLSNIPNTTNIKKEQMVLEVPSNIVVRPEQFGAKGDGIVDDAEAINKTIAYGSYIKFGKGKTYNLKSKIVVLKPGVTIDLNGSRLVMNGKYIQNCNFGEVTYGFQGHGDLTVKNGTIEHGEICIAHASNIKIENINFKNSDGHFIQIMSCSDVLISNCTFKGIKTYQKDGITPTKTGSCECINLDPCVYSAFRLYGKDSPSYDGTNNTNIIIENCVSEKGTDEGYTAPQRLGFSHFHVSDNLYHNNIIVRNNVVYGSEEMCCMRFYDFHNSEIYNNQLHSKFEKVFVKKYDYNNHYFDNRIMFSKRD